MPRKRQMIESVKRMLLENEKIRYIEQIISGHVGKPSGVDGKSATLCPIRERENEADPETNSVSNFTFDFDAFNFQKSVFIS
jgi:hypothetical protein